MTHPVCHWFSITERGGERSRKVSGTKPDFLPSQAYTKTALTFFLCNQSKLKSENQPISFGEKVAFVRVLITSSIPWLSLWDWWPLLVWRWYSKLWLPFLKQRPSAPGLMNKCKTLVQEPVSIDFHDKLTWVIPGMKWRNISTPGYSQWAKKLKTPALSKWNKERDFFAFKINNNK